MQPLFFLIYFFFFLCRYPYSLLNSMRPTWSGVFQRINYSLKMSQLSNPGSEQRRSCTGLYKNKKRKQWICSWQNNQLEAPWRKTPPHRQQHLRHLSVSRKILEILFLKKSFQEMKKHDHICICERFTDHPSGFCWWGFQENISRKKILSPVMFVFNNMLKQHFSLWENEQ